jgi:hypothetical protein
MKLKWLIVFCFTVLTTALALALFFEEWMQAAGLATMIVMAYLLFSSIEALDKETAILRQRSWTLTQDVAEAHAKGYNEGRIDEALKLQAELTELRTALEGKAEVKRPEFKPHSLKPGRQFWGPEEPQNA